MLAWRRVAGAPDRALRREAGEGRVGVDRPAPGASGGHACCRTSGDPVGAHACDGAVVEGPVDCRPAERVELRVCV